MSLRRLKIQHARQTILTEHMLPVNGKNTRTKEKNEVARPGFKGILNALRKKNMTEEYPEVREVTL